MVKTISRYTAASAQRVELHLHTTYSAIDGLTRVSDVIKRAAGWGSPAIAITDHGNVQAFPAAWKASQKYGIKVIYGLEAYYVNDVDFLKSDSMHHIILLVKNKFGLKNLYTLISKSSTGKHPLITKSLIQQFRDGLIIGSACASGEVFSTLIESPDKVEQLAEFYDYLEIQPVCNNRFLISSGRAKNDEYLRQLNLQIAKLAKKLGKPLVATGDVHFLDPEDEVCRRVLLSARGFENSDTHLPLYLKSTEELLKEFSYLGEALCEEAVITNPRKIAALCNDIELLPKGKVLLPQLENAKQDMIHICQDKLRELYGESTPPLVRNRLDDELSLLLPYGYDVIYMTSSKLVQKSQDAGYPVGSRGGVAATFIAYLLGITDINPLPPHYHCPHCKYSDFANSHKAACGVDMPDAICPKCGEKLIKDGFNIPFETFLGCVGQEKLPDIDLNFSGEYQQRAIVHLKKLFGEDHVFKAGTVCTIMEETAGSLVDEYINLRNLQLSDDERQTIEDHLVGIKRTGGQHPGGYVIIPQSMDAEDFCPVYRLPEMPDSELATTQFEYHDMANCFLKFDILGHNVPTILNKLAGLTGINSADIPLDDSDTMNLFRSADTAGVPEFDSDSMRSMLEDFPPDCFSDLIRLSAISHGTDIWQDNAQQIVCSGKATIKEIVSTRDDIFLSLIDRGMPVEKAYRLMETIRQGNVKMGIVADGWDKELKEFDVPEWYISSLSKVSYLFPKAHAVAYVTNAFRIAWFKVHYPSEFHNVIADF